MITFSSDEIIILEVRKHWLFITAHAVVLFVLAVIPLLVVPFVLEYFFSNVLRQVRGDSLASLYLFTGAAWVWFVWVMFFVMWTNYYLDVLVITNKRLIDMEQFVLFSRDEVVIPLTSIEDIKIETIGVLATLFRYGNLQIQTAGAARETIAPSIKQPEQALACLEHAVENQRKLV